MASRALLPQSAYDYFVRDGRDGEMWGPFDTVSAQTDKLNEERAKLATYERGCIERRRVVSERKVARLLRAAGAEWTTARRAT